MNTIAKKLTLLAIVLCAGGSAWAQTQTTSGNIDPGAVKDLSLYGGGFTNGVAGVASFAVNRFDGQANPAKILTGATFSASLGSEQLWYTPSPGFYGTTYVHTNGIATLSVGGTTATAFSPYLFNVPVSGPTGRTLDAYTVQSVATTQAQLDNLYRATTASPLAVDGTISEKLSIDVRNGGSPSPTVDNISLRGATVTTTYTTINHASGSFGSDTSLNSIDLNFATAMAGTSFAALSFNIYNMLGSFGLRITDIDSSNAGIFSLSGLSNVDNLAAGHLVTGSVTMAPHAAAGNYYGYWDVNVADSSLGIGAGKNVSSTGVLRVNAHAQITSPVPEPETYAMFLAGLGLMGAVARRSKQK